MFCFPKEMSRKNTEAKITREYDPYDEQEEKGGAVELGGSAGNYRRRFPVVFGR